MGEGGQGSSGRNAWEREEGTVQDGQRKMENEKGNRKEAGQQRHVGRFFATVLLSAGKEGWRRCHERTVLPHAFLMEEEEDVPAAGTDNHHLPDLGSSPPPIPHLLQHPSGCVPQAASSSTSIHSVLSSMHPSNPPKPSSPPLPFTPDASVPSSCSFYQSSRDNKVNGKEGVTANKRTPARRLYMLQRLETNGLLGLNAHFNSRAREQISSTV